jgi:hypothetical protein
MTGTLRADAVIRSAPDTLVADASDLGLRPGQWPAAIVVNHNGKGYVFRRTGLDLKRVDQEPVYIQYARNGVMLNVFND